MNCQVKTNIHPSIHTIIETTLSKDVQEKLDMINWDSVRSVFFDKDNNLRGKGKDGVPFTAEQANALIEGKAVVHSGQRKDGETFTCCVQFDAARREPAVSHPSRFKEAQRAGMDMTPKQRQEQQEKAVQQQKASQEQGQKKFGGLKK